MAIDPEESIAISEELSISGAPTPAIIFRMENQFESWGFVRIKSRAQTRVASRDSSSTRAHKFCFMCPVLLISLGLKSFGVCVKVAKAEIVALVRSKLCGNYENRLKSGRVFIADMSKATSRIPTFRPKATAIPRKPKCPSNSEDGISSGPYSMLFIDKKSETYLGDSYDPATSPHENAIIRAENENDLQESANNEPINLSSNQNESVVEVKRRRTFQLDDLHRKTSLTILMNSSNNASTHHQDKDFEEVLIKKLQLQQQQQQQISNIDEDGSKRDSLEFDESLGILTPEQMDDGMSFMSAVNFKALSSECIIPAPNGEKNVWKPPQTSKSDMNSPNNVDGRNELPSPNIVTSNTDFSLGLIDEQLLSNLTLRTDTTMNMELPLDTIDPNSRRLEQTPSPEDLPLDPAPATVENSQLLLHNKSEITSNINNTHHLIMNNNKSKSIITSITSITSLDTGYQGDGEMSRPASRGADNSSSPLTRRPLPRPQTRRNDPMTDSDFYTESDADNHEENPLRGDRRAQVIDGTLYGVDPQAAADIYVNNRENMDSSGIFTDIERTDEDNPRRVSLNPDVSPSDTSTKTISGQSQNNLHQESVDNKNSEPSIDNSITNHTNNNNNNNNTDNNNSKKRTASSPVTSTSPSSVRSPRHHRSGKEESSVSAAKKYKMPKREVVSKVKAMLESSNAIEKTKSAGKKPAGRWDAVMNKISKSEQTSKTNLKEVKSKIFSSVGSGGGGSPTQTSRQSDGIRNKTATRLNYNQKNSNIKPRRIRSRTCTIGNPVTCKKDNVESSIHSSLSDLSATGAPPKGITSSTKNKRDVVQVTQVLTASKLVPNNNRNNGTNQQDVAVKKHQISSNKRLPLAANKQTQHTQQQNSNKESGRATVKGGRTSPVVRPPVHSRTPSKATPKVAEALAVLVQHLVFNVEAYRVPNLKQQVQKFRNEADQLRETYQHLEAEHSKQIDIFEEMRAKYSNEISELQEKHQNQILELNNQLYELERRLTEEHETNSLLVSKQNDEKLVKLKIEFEKLQKSHQESVDILREENDAIREQIDEKNAQIDGIEREKYKIKEQHLHISKENQKLRQEMIKMEEKIKERVQGIYDENQRLREENDRLLAYSNSDTKGMQEVQSLRVVLELKQNEVADLRRNLAEATQKIDTLAGAEEKANCLNARCEDLELQLQRKSEYEQSLIADNKKLHESLKEEGNHKRRLCQYNEELQWKLKQNKEVVTKVLEQAAEESVFNRNVLSGSFNERHHSTPVHRHNFERSLSLREPNISKVGCSQQKRNGSSRCDLKEEDEDSPPMSPKVKGVVEKSEWVSYVLDLEESPDIVASRIVRRSFRNSTPPKTTPTKSPSNNKRARMKNPLCPSASASAILPSTNQGDDFNNTARSRSLSNRSIVSNVVNNDGASECDLDHLDLDDEDEDDNDDDEDVDLKLPALPSEIGRKCLSGPRACLPSPKHLAGEAMISESNSEDESTSSSSVQL